MENEVLAEELLIVDGDARLWQAARPLLDVALRMEQGDESFVWHGWNRQQIERFLAQLPSPSSIVVGVWETIPADEEEQSPEREMLILGMVCEVVEREVRSIRTFEALENAGLKPVEQLEPGYEDALEVLRIARKEVAPAAWALFIDKPAWDEWLFASSKEGSVVDKGELLAQFARKGRCVLLGSQVRDE
jgi:hypothetical protein